MSEQISEELQKAFKVCADEGYAVITYDNLHKIEDELQGFKTMFNTISNKVVLTKQTVKGEDSYLIQIDGCWEEIEESEYELFKGWLKNE